MRVLVLCDDFWHPAAVPRAGLATLAAPGLRFDIVEDAADWSRDRMRDYPVAMLIKSNDVSSVDRSPWMSPQVEAAFVEYVRQGGGLLAVHSGTAGYGETPRLRALLGGVFEHHPKQCPVTFSPKVGHPLAAGCTSFTVIDEHYFMAIDDPSIDVYGESVSEHGSQPAAWTRLDRLGRVCVITPGHNLEVWQEPSFQSLVRNALRWCAPYHRTWEC